jgi:hypothetical protein
MPGRRSPVRVDHDRDADFDYEREDEPPAAARNSIALALSEAAIGLAVFVAIDRGGVARWRTSKLILTRPVDHNEGKPQLAIESPQLPVKAHIIRAAGNTQCGFELSRRSCGLCGVSHSSGSCSLIAISMK